MISILIPYLPDLRDGVSRNYLMSSTPISTPYPESFKAFNPATGEQIGEVPCTPLEDMPQIFE
ncbi:MAG: hypothetical protein ACI86H_001094, partial [bacterium]